MNSGPCAADTPTDTNVIMELYTGPDSNINNADHEKTINITGTPPSAFGSEQCVNILAPNIKTVFLCRNNNKDAVAQCQSDEYNLLLDYVHF